MGLILMVITVIVLLSIKYLIKNNPKPKIWKEGNRGKDSECHWYHTYDTEKCPFCGCTNIFSGSWSPETCTNCKATYMIGVWIRSKRNDRFNKSSN